MKVKIIKCCQSCYWYRDMVGKIVDVTPYENTHGVYRYDGIRYIQQEDCITISELRDSSINEILGKTKYYNERY